jgi:hypothetical protein
VAWSIITRIRFISSVAIALAAASLVVASPAFAEPTGQHLTLASSRAILASGNGQPIGPYGQPIGPNGQQNVVRIIVGPTAHEL